MVVSEEEFRRAVLFGSVDDVETMLKADPSMATNADDYGYTVLHELGAEERPDVARLLVKHGADPNARNDSGMTPLHLANSPVMAQVLVELGADVNAKSDAGQSPLCVLAAEADGYDSMQVLIEAGADPVIKDDYGQTPADIARRREEHDKVALLEG